MKYAEAWAHLKRILEKDAQASGEMMSMAEHTWTTLSASRYLEIINSLEEEYE